MAYSKNRVHKSLLCLALVLFVSVLLIIPNKNPAEAAGPAFVQSVTATRNASGGALAASGITTGSGDLIIIAVTWDQGACGGCSMSVSDSRSNAWTAATGKQVDTRNNTDLQIFFAANINGGASHIFTATPSSNASFIRMVVHEVSGIAAISALDNTAVVNNEAGSPVSVGPIVTTALGDYIFAVAMNDSDSNTIAANPPFIERATASASNFEMQSQDTIQAAVGSISATWTTSGTDSIMAQMAAFKAAAAGPPDAAAPSVPGNLSAAAVSSSAINLSWTASTDNTAVSGYKIFRGGAQIATSATNSYSDSGLSASTAYSYTISAFDAAGNNSTQSNAASATTLASGNGSANLHATTANFASVWNSAAPGDVIALSTGNYGTFSGGSKSSVVTIQPESGATPSMGINFNGSNNIKIDGLTINGMQLTGARNITIQNSRFTAPGQIDTTIANANIILDHDTFDNLPQGTYEGRISVRGYSNTAPVGVTISNSHFGGGCSDGVQVIGGAYGVVIGPGNEFTGITQSGCDPVHADPIQFYGESHTTVTGNWFHDNGSGSGGIMSPDGSSYGIITNNVFASTGYAYAINCGGCVNFLFSHNTVNPSQSIHFANSNSGASGSGNTITNNVAQGGIQSAGSTEDYNLVSGGGSGSHDISGNPVFVGGTVPGSFAGYKLASNSLGLAKANDGGDMGITAGGSVGADTAAPSVPGGLSVGAVSSSQINLSWAPSTDNVGVAGYKVFRNGSQIATAASASYSDTAVTSAAQYSYTVSAFDAAGNNSAQSSSVSVTAQTVPLLITYLNGRNTTDSTTSIAWNTSIPTNGQVFYGLTSAYGSQSSLLNNSPKTTAHSATLANLAPSTTYHFSVTSADSINNSTSSPDFTFTTLPTGGITVYIQPFPGFPVTGGEEGPLRLINSSGTFYLIISNLRHGITGPGILTTYGLSFKDAKLATAADLQIPEGSFLSPQNGSLVKSKNDPTVYLISNSQKYGFTSESVFLGLGFKFSSVLVVTAPELEILVPAGSINDAGSAHLSGTDINDRGTIYNIGPDNQRQAFDSIAVYNSWHVANDFSRVVPANTADLALPAGDVMAQRIVN